MKIIVEVNANLMCESLPEWGSLSDEVLRRLTPIGELFGVIPQGCTIEAELSEEEKQKMPNRNGTGPNGKGPRTGARAWKLPSSEEGEVVV